MTMNLYLNLSPKDEKERECKMYMNTLFFYSEHSSTFYAIWWWSDSGREVSRYIKYLHSCVTRLVWLISFFVVNHLVKLWFHAYLTKARMSLHNHELPFVVILASIIVVVCGMLTCVCSFEHRIFKFC